MNSGQIKSFKKVGNNEVDFTNFSVGDCESHPIIPKYDKNGKRLKGDSKEYQHYLNQVCDSVSVEYMTADTTKVTVRSSYICCKSFVGQINHCEEESAIQLIVTPFGNHCYCSCIYTFEFEFILPESKKYNIEFVNCGR